MRSFYSALARASSTTRQRPSRRLSGTASASGRRTPDRFSSTSYTRGGWGRARKNATRYRSGYHKGQVKSGWYGKVYRTGKYANSIRHQMTSQGGSNAEGEIGSATMPGLAHLLEKGHATIGGGFVAGREHIAPAADDAFDKFETFLSEAIQEAIDEV